MMIALIKSKKLMLKSSIKQLESSPWNYLSLWGKQIYKSGLYTAHRKVSNTPNEIIQYQIQQLRSKESQTLQDRMKLIFKKAEIQTVIYCYHGPHG